MYGDDLLKVSQPTLEGNYTFIMISAADNNKVLAKKQSIEERLKQSGLSLVKSEKQNIAGISYLKLFYPQKNYELLVTLYPMYQ